MRKTALIIFAYAILAFAACLAVSFAIQNLPELLAGEKIKYLILRGLIIFLKFAPALILGGFIVGCAVSYGHDSAKAKIKFSKTIMTHFKKTLIASILIAFATTMITEIFLPMSESYQHMLELKPSVFDEYMKLANSYFEQGKMDEALDFSANALKINPKDEKAQWLKEHSEANVKSAKNVKNDDEEAKFVYIPFDETEGETVASLIKKAKDAEERNDWFHAHYYAYMAVNIGTSRDTNYSDAKRLASEAWNHLFDTNIFEETEEQKLFKKKREAYLSLIKGDNIEAYYQFLEISNTNDMAARDPDVVQFLKIAEERVSRQCFFVEETNDLKQFETANNIYFTISHDDGEKDVVYIRGITPVKNSGGMIQYLRGFKMMCYDKNGEFKMSVSTPYAKMISLDVKTFDEKSKQEFGIKDEFKNVPYLMLEGISKDLQKERISPVYEFDAKSNKNFQEIKNYFVLGLSTNDFNSLCTSGIDPTKMNLISLSKLLPKARDFGFSYEVYNSTFLCRATYPLVILLSLMVLACFAWNCRLEAPIFKFKWIFIIPFISAVIFAVLELILYMLKLLNFVLAVFTGNFALIISFAILTVLLFLVCLIFVNKTA